MAKTYVRSLESWIVTLNERQIQGFGLGDSITIARSEDRSTMVLGTGGEVTHDVRPSHGAQVTLSVLRSSIANSIIKEETEAALASREPLRLVAENLLSDEKFVSNGAMLATEADMVGGVETTTSDWVFNAAVDEWVR